MDDECINLPANDKALPAWLADLEEEHGRQIVAKFKQDKGIAGSQALP